MIAKIGKVLFSALLAFAILTAFCFLYFNRPVHYDCRDGATDYVWQSNKFRSDCTEGFSFGHTNNEGYSNSFDYEENMPIKVLIMGSSHMEALNVQNNESTAFQLNEMIDGNVYNIGMSNHYFLTCIKNLKNASEKYSPEFIVIETNTVRFAQEDVAAVLNGTYPSKESHSDGIIGIIQKNPFLRCVYTQMKLAFSNTSGTDLSNAAGKETEETPDIKTEPGENSNQLSALFEKMNSDRGQAKIIILYQPDKGNREDTSAFESACILYGFSFVDMRERFEKEYKENRIYPHGFANTPAGEGHLNKYGHRMIADELLAEIEEVG